MQKCVYKKTFKNVDKFKMQVLKSGFTWCPTLLTLLLTNGESICMPRRAYVHLMGRYFEHFYSRQLQK